MSLGHYYSVVMDHMDQLLLLKFNWNWIPPSRLPDGDITAGARPCSYGHYTVRPRSRTRIP